MLLDLLLINVIVSAVMLSGFWDTLDTMVEERWRFYHLPYIFHCGLCQVFWLSILYVLFTKISILTIALCPLNALLVDFVMGALGTIRRFLSMILEKINDLL